MTADEQYICCSQILLMALGALWALAARLHPPRDRGTSEPVCRLTQALTLVYRCHVAVTFAVLCKSLRTSLVGKIVSQLNKSTLD